MEIEVILTNLIIILMDIFCYLSFYSYVMLQ